MAALLRRLTLPDDQGSLPRPAELGVDRYVASYDIAEERMAATQYLASLNVTFVPQEIRDLLRSTGLSFVERKSPPLLVVPVTLGPDAPTAWDEGSPWRAAWDRAVEQDATIAALALPLGDLADVAAAPPRALAEGDAAALGALASRYGAEPAYVTTAALRLAPDGTTPQAVDTVLRRGDRWQEPVLRMTLDALPQETEAALLERAAARVVDAIEDDWKRDTLVPISSLSVLPVRVPLADLASWVQIRRDLSGLPLVRELKIDRFGRTEATLRIAYVGDLDQLLAAVGQLGLTLSQEGDQWLLRRAGDPAAVLAPSSGLPALQ
jgi:hypothetical protein